MTELMSPYDIMEKFVEIIEKQRVRKNMTQAELYKASGMSAKSYANFISTKTTKFENIVNLMIALDMNSKLEILITQDKYTSLDEIRDEKKQKIKKRVRKG